ncbi:hypothetical protein KF146_1130 [Lactococcus lactis subsp. lactis]|nr:hypothetical protein KF146_1130 [Lactococcus lactis subsp. lactis]
MPRFTDGTEITAKDLADMNINALDNIAGLIGFELEEYIKMPSRMTGLLEL